MIKKWEELPESLRTEEVRPYYERLKKRQGSMLLKRCFDILGSFIMLILLSPVFLVLSIAIKADSPGPVFFRQRRVTRYGREFMIFKFRTMVDRAESMGSSVTVDNDSRITRLGGFIRGCRLDEIPQLINILRGDMSFVGTRPEVPKYVAFYTPEMLATLLMPAGVTSQASILYKDENTLLQNSADPDRVYINEIMPDKMKYNLKQLTEFSFAGDIKIMLRTVKAVAGH